PNLDFTRLFTCIACKAGSSEVLHIDWNDELSRYAIVVVVGKFTGAHFCTPQLGIHIPVRGGSVLVVKTRLLAHCATVVASG
ncbi:hypothetical protein B0H12DRAFT_988829, partial [Mycena haematopus]